MLQANQISSYIFRFQDTALPLPVSLYAVGRERKTSDYSHAGMTRKDRSGAYLFQYTVAGQAAIRINDQVFRLDAGTGFLVPFHSDYHYYIPEESCDYECLFLSFDGNEAAKCWSFFVSQLGSVHHFSEHSSPIRLANHIYQEASAKKISDAYKLSAFAYQFLMELYRYGKGLGMPKVWPEIVTQAVQLIDEHYHEMKSLDELAHRLGVSKYHLIKLFNRSMGKTPVEYLTRKRMEKAVELLRTTTWSLEQISQEIGYADVNYFSKVFRKSLGIPPGRLRKDYDSYDFMFD
ncbi:helix-turn-helix domain-containing protein [Paenibacillus allorhizosphaerae]|uniref:HTH-type transcriptional activator RhaS n=1 Tax=Paenibacillus allorhizosphaerae TaxID=2849866 RepID=A0ABM8VMX9_9BACL|nr:AraC family transcriptional regulator [Paenibacillus allorhizosphaerae]CAG7650577.1 HTH-type transcriptional activator RhaS [Paenibacillus allorhizosphaerae]